MKRSQQHGVPTVFVDQGPDDHPARVILDQRQATFDTFEHLAKLGHRDVTAVMHPFHLNVRLDHARALEAAAAAQDVTLRPMESWCIGEPWASDAPIDRLRDLLAESTPPTALVCINDAIAQNALAAAHDLGLRVPDDLSIVGQDDLPLARATRPTLTTRRHPDPKRVATAAFAMLDQLIDDPHAELEPVTFDQQLIVRDSTGPARTHELPDTFPSRTPFERSRV